MSSPTPPIEPLVPSYNIRILPDEKLEQFKLGALQLLERTGFKCPSERALKIYADNGAQVDFETQIVKLPVNDIALTRSQIAEEIKCWKGLRKYSNKIIYNFNRYLDENIKIYRDI